jgi:hypothetical protein
VKALGEFRNLLNSIPLLVLKDKEEMNDVEALQQICLNYIISLMCALQRNKVKKKPLEHFRLTVLMSLCQT